jgi:MYXO-CTERM domain-containing protein
VENPGELTLTLQIDDTAGTPPDLALIAVQEETDGSCLPGGVVAWSDEMQDASANPDEVVTFTAEANTRYFVVVDGQMADSTGAYQLHLACALDCADTETQCGNECADLFIDPQNCGECGNVCFYDHASPRCSGGSCQMGDCHGGWGDCNVDSGDGCETRLGTNENCGFCGDVCYFEHAEPLCQNDECLLLSCDTGYGNCNGDTQDGCEADLNTFGHCGGCDQECNPGQVCHQGDCLDSCPGGFTDCGGSCVDTDSHPDHCGGCDSSCSVPNGIAVCESGACAVGECLPGFGDCINGYDDGCETELSSPAHCGTCDNACEFEHAEAECVTGVCVLGDCIPPWDNCNQSADDGCEENLQLSEANCGVCANQCNDDESCLNGECSFECADQDNDGFGDEACGGPDCDDDDATIYPGAPDPCGDGIDQDCDGEDLECICDDDDFDGHMDMACGGDDCDDSNGFIHPGAEEVCEDGIDQDCDGSDIACTCMDSDGDGFPSATCGGTDCNDNNRFIYPGSFDECGDGVDQDCDGLDKSCDSGGCGCAGHQPARGSAALLSLGLAVAILRRRRKHA